MKTLILLGLIIAISTITGCSAPVPTSIPEYPSKKKVCIKHECRAMGPGDNSGTTRGYSDDPQD